MRVAMRFCSQRVINRQSVAVRFTVPARLQVNTTRSPGFRVTRMSVSCANVTGSATSAPPACSHDSLHNKSITESERKTNANVTDSVQPEHVDQVMTLTDNMGGESLHVEDPAQEIKVMPNPFDHTDVGDLLTRRYLVASFEWDSSDVNGTEFATLDFPSALVNKPFIHQKLQRFRYFRANVKVTIEINGNTGAAGALLFWHRPYAGGRVFSIAQKRLLNPVVISAQKASSVTVEIPYLYPLSWIDLSVSNQVADKIGSIGFIVLSRLQKLSDSVSDVHARVFAEFVNPEVCWPVARDVLAPLPSAQGKRSKTASRAVASEEAKEKSSGGVISGVARAVGSAAPVLSVIPEVGIPLGLGAQLVGSLAPILESMGLGKPSNTSAVQYMIPQMYNGWAHMCGLSNTARLAADPDQSLLGPTVPDPVYDLRELAQRPSFVGTGLLTPDLGPGSLVYTFNMMNGPPGSTWTAWDTWVRNGYSMYKGGIKFKVQFWSTQMVTCRVAIVMVENGQSYDMPSSLSDAPIRIIDIEGDCEVDFTVPYVWPTPYRSRTVGPPFMLQMYVLNPVSSLTGDMDIGFTVWRAFADDFQAQFPELWFTAEPQLAGGQGYVNEQFKEKFDPLAYGATGFADAGWTADEQVYDVRAILKRPLLADMVQGADQYKYDPWKTLYQSQIQGVHHPYLYWLLAYNYFRGSIRSHWVTRSPSYQEVGKAAVPLSNTSQPFEEFELPWYSTIPYSYCVNPLFQRDATRNTVIHSPLARMESPYKWEYLYLSLAEDLELGYPLAPPDGINGYNHLPATDWPADYTVVDSVPIPPMSASVVASKESETTQIPSTPAPTAGPDSVDDASNSAARVKDHKLSAKRARQE